MVRLFGKIATAVRDEVPDKGQRERVYRVMVREFANTIAGEMGEWERLDPVLDRVLREEGELDGESDE